MRRNPKRALVASRGVEVSFGSHGLKAMTHARVKSNQLESARKVIVRNLGKTGKVWSACSRTSRSPRSRPK